MVHHHLYRRRSRTRLLVDFRRRLVARTRRSLITLKWATQLVV